MSGATSTNDGYMRNATRILSIMTRPFKRRQVKNSPSNNLVFDKPSADTAERVTVAQHQAAANPVPAKVVTTSNQARAPVRIIKPNQKKEQLLGTDPVGGGGGGSYGSNGDVDHDADPGTHHCVPEASSAGAIHDHGGHDHGDAVVGGDSGGGYDGGGYDAGGDYGGCFSGSSLVRVVNRNRSEVLKQIQDLKKGDRIICSLNNYSAEIDCVVAMRVLGGVHCMYELPSGLQVTGRHPVFDTTANSWILPQDLHPSIVKKKKIPCTHVYNILLNLSQELNTLQPHTSTIVVNSITCVALGHGLTQEHGFTLKTSAFWRDRELILKSLREIDSKGLENGWIEVGGMLRDQSDGAVYGYAAVSDETIANVKRKHPLISPAVRAVVLAF